MPPQIEPKQGVKTAHRVRLPLEASKAKLLDVWVCDATACIFAVEEGTLPLCCPKCGVWYDTMPDTHVQALADSEAKQQEKPSNEGTR